MQYEFGSPMATVNLLSHVCKVSAYNVGKPNPRMFRMAYERSGRPPRMFRMAYERSRSAPAHVLHGVPEVPVISAM